MLYVAFLYVSIRYEGEGRTAVLPWYVSIRYEGEGRTAVLPWYVSICYEGEGRTAEQFFLHPHNVSRHTKLQHTANERS